MFNRNFLKRVCIGAFFGVVITGLVLFVFAIVMRFSTLPDNTTELFSIAAMVLGVLSGGLLSALRAQCYGGLSGGFAGMLYMIFLQIISLFVFGSPGILKLLLNLIIGFITGAAGGIAGINIRSGKRRRSA